ncbi:acyltransferase family protein [Seohaeicola zhoushanensis]|uniref:Acyltransferase n=1 Tax=Seohaeicola zhoushanensis TaxID=1569283 RepID=A0A8J3H1W5_9RHOB|nr:acyltransferase [Seohaeicola zhoushanensis]GHF74944.1 acyltransferase [Seohaeicola zhoushanensis]
MTATQAYPIRPGPEVQSLTALRGVAALWVVLYHYEHHFVADFGQVIGMGDLAVDLFFVLSGFIMVYVYRDRARFGPFLLKRFARLFPVHAVTLAGVAMMIAAAGFLGVQSDGKVEPWPFVMNLLCLHGWGLLNNMSLNYPSWSISAEFAAYLVFPAIAGPLLKMPLARAILLALIFAAACIWVADATGRKIYLRSFDFSPIRILPEFVLGMIAARIGLETRLNPCAVLLVAAVPLAGGLFWASPLLFIAGVPLLVLGLFLCDRPLPAALLYLGRISYSLYMVHALVEKAGFSLAERALGTELMPLWVLPVMLAAAIAAAAVLYHAVEVPGRRILLPHAAGRLS